VSSTITGGSGADTILVAAGISKTSIAAGLGNDSLTFAAITASTILGGGGTDTFSVTGVVSGSTITFSSDATTYWSSSSQVTSSVLTAGSGNDTLIFGGAASLSTLLGGAGTDSIVIGPAASDSTTTQVRVIGGADADTIAFTSFASSSTIAGGTGNDTVSFVSSFTGVSSGNTYFFGTNGGQDTINFGTTFSAGNNVASGNALTIAYSADSGSTSTAVTIDSLTYASTSQTKIAIGSTNAIWVVGYSQGAITLASGSPVLITTVSNATITALG